MSRRRPILSRSSSGRLRLCVAVAATMALALLQASTSAAASPLRVFEGGGTAFPGRSLVLSVPAGAGVQPRGIHVSENGTPISGAIVTPIANAATGDFGVVLAIDVGPSMRGVPLQRAMEAARALAAQRSGNQEIAVVTFDQSATVALLSKVTTPISWFPDRWAASARAACIAF